MRTAKTPNVPSLIAPWPIGSRMTCLDCHNRNTAPGAGGTHHVTPSSNGRLEFRHGGRFRGQCSLTCHGSDHKLKSYGP